jgi:hypothetical protein
MRRWTVTGRRGATWWDGRGWHAWPAAHRARVEAALGEPTTPAGPSFDPDVEPELAALAAAIIADPHARLIGARIEEVVPPVPPDAVS